MRRPRIQVSAQYLTAGAGGIARCARLSLLALSEAARVAALAVEDDASTQVGRVTSRAFAGDRSRFVGANALGALTRDWVLYDFAGTARAHAPLGLLRRPYAVWAHGWEVWPGNLRPDYAKALLGAKAVFVNSRHTGERLAQSLPELERVHCCLLGTEEDVSDAPKCGEREKRVLFVGRSDEMFAKGQDILIAAWPAVVAEVPEAKLTFAGGGERLDRLRALAAASPAAASIEVLGPLSDAQIAALQRRSRLCAMLSNVEGFGLVFAEAMRQGAPVLSGDEDASTEVNLDGVTGFAVDRGDLASITERIVAVLQYDRLFDQLSRKAHERWAAEFRFSAFRDRFLDAAEAAGMVRRRPARRAEPLGAT